MRLAVSVVRTDGEVSVQTLARRMADELYAVVEAVDDCQLAVENILDRGLTRDDMVRLQALDALGQTIAELAGVMERLGGSDASGAADGSLFDAVKLSDLRRRLRGQAATVVAEGDEPELW
jgi:hypothetical protein